MGIDVLVFWGTEIAADQSVELLAQELVLGGEGLDLGVGVLELADQLGQDHAQRLGELREELRCQVH